MPNMKAIKRRRLTVKNISQITKAMNLVATSKLQRAKNALAVVSAPTLATFEIMYTAAGHPGAQEMPLLTARKEVKTTAYLLISANRGLCGGYNAAVSKELARHAKENGANALIVPIGTKGRDYLRRRGFNVAEGGHTQDNITQEDATAIAKRLADMYTSGQVDEVYIVYTQFITVLNLQPVVRKLLPIDPGYLRRALSINLQDGESWEDLGFFAQPAIREAGNAEVEFEPGLEEVLAGIMPWYVSMFVYAATVSGTLCEHAARMTSMDSSTKNAADIIEKLTLQYNRQRQSIITQEITEIVSGANALN